MIGNFITEFDEEFNVIQNIKSDKIDISKNEWIIYNAKIFKKNEYESRETLNQKTSFNLERIRSLYSNLSSNLIVLYELRENYKN